MVLANTKTAEWRNKKYRVPLDTKTRLDNHRDIYEFINVCRMVNDSAVNGQDITAPALEAFYRLFVAMALYTIEGY